MTTDVVHNNISKFEWITRINDAKLDDSADVLYLEGLASTNVSRDTYGTKPSDKILKYMMKEAPNLNVHLSHGFDNMNLPLNNVVGKILKAEIRDNSDLWIQCSIVYPELARIIKRLLDHGVKLGFSIGGRFETNSEGEFIDGYLIEVSLVSLPSVRESFGTVKVVDNVTRSDCFEAICRSMNIKDIVGGNNMTQENNNKESNVELDEIKRELAEAKKALAETKRALEEEINKNNDVLENPEDKIMNKLDEMDKGFDTRINQALNEFKGEFIKEVTDTAAERAAAIAERSILDKISKSKEESDAKFKEEDEESNKKEEPGEEPENDDESNKKEDTKRSITDDDLANLKKQLREDIINDLAGNRDVKRFSKVQRAAKENKEDEDVSLNLTPEEAAKLI